MFHLFRRILSFDRLSKFSRFTAWLHEAFPDSSGRAWKRACRKKRHLIEALKLIRFTLTTFHRRQTNNNALTTWRHSKTILSWRDQTSPTDKECRHRRRQTSTSFTTVKSRTKLPTPRPTLSELRVRNTSEFRPDRSACRSGTRTRTSTPPMKATHRPGLPGTVTLHKIGEKSLRNKYEIFSFLFF